MKECQPTVQENNFILFIWDVSDIPSIHPSMIYRHPSQYTGLRGGWRLNQTSTNLRETGNLTPPWHQTPSVQMWTCRTTEWFLALKQVRPSTWPGGHLASAFYKEHMVLVLRDYTYKHRLDYVFPNRLTVSNHSSALLNEEYSPYVWTGGLGRLTHTHMHSQG